VRRRDTEAQIALCPTTQVSIGTRLRYQLFVRTRDGSVIGTKVVTRLRLEYQSTRALFLPLVVQMELRDRRAMRDPRTERPLLRRSASGSVVERTAPKSLLGRGDVLVSCPPSPGAVVYVGYGTGVDATKTTRLTDVQRTNDGAFVKISYLFRVRGTTR
jgi:hypothetical protein